MRSVSTSPNPPSSCTTPCRLSATAYSVYSQLQFVSAGRSCNRNLRTRLAVLTGTHLSRCHAVVTETQVPCRGDRGPFVTVPCRGDRDPFVTVPCRDDRDPFVTVPCRGDRDPFVTVPCRGDRDPFVTVSCRGDRDPFVTVPCRDDRDPFVTVPCRGDRDPGAMPW